MSMLGGEEMELGKQIKKRLFSVLNFSPKDDLTVAFRGFFAFKRKCRISSFLNCANGSDLTELKLFLPKTVVFSRKSPPILHRFYKTLITDFALF